MEEVFVIDGEKFEDVEKQLKHARDRMIEIRKTHHLDSGESNGTNLEVCAHTPRSQDSYVTFQTCYMYPCL